MVARQSGEVHELADHNPCSGSADPPRAVVRLHDNLAWDPSDPQRPVVTHGGEPVASFECLVPDQPRVLTKIEFLGGNRRVDVTVQPDTVVHLIRRLATRRNNNAAAWERALKQRLLTAADDWGLGNGIETADSPADVIAMLGFPIARSARSHGVTPPPWVPRWAEPVLAAADARAASRAGFEQRASRRVARVLSESLIGARGGDGGGTQQGPQQMVLTPLSMALALPASASADVIANVLAAPTAAHASQHWPSVDELEVIRRGFKLIGPEASARFAIEALTTIAGPGRLVASMVHVPRLLSSSDAPFPRHIQGLEEAVAEFSRPPIEVVRQVQPPPPARRVVVDPPAPAERAVANHRDQRVAPNHAAPPARVAAHDGAGVIDLPVEPLYAPGPDEQAARRGDVRYPEAVRRIHGATSGDFSLRLPGSRAELGAWGRELRNCMADYVEAVAAGESVILGLYRRDKLVAGIELTADLRRVRQFVRDGNQRPWRAQREAVREMLGRLGVAGG